MRKNCYIYEIEYTYKNGYRNAHKILSKIDDPDKIKNIIKTQLEKSNKARFKVLLGSKNKFRVARGWLLDMDLKNYSITPIGIYYNKYKVIKMD